MLSEMSAHKHATRPQSPFRSVGLSIRFCTLALQPCLQGVCSPNPRVGGTVAAT
jgi:hypothetical protein